MVKKRCVISINVEPDLKEWLERQSESAQRSLSAQISYILSLHRLGVGSGFVEIVRPMEWPNDAKEVESTWADHERLLANKQSTPNDLS